MFPALTEDCLDRRAAVSKTARSGFDSCLSRQFGDVSRWLTPTGACARALQSASPRYTRGSPVAEIKTIIPVEPAPGKPAAAPPVSVIVPAGALPETPILAVIEPAAQPVTVVSKAAHKLGIADFLDTYAAPEWRFAHKLWTVRIAIFWAIFGGLWVALPAFQNFLPAFWFAVACVGFSLAILFARLTNQPGLPA